MIDSHCHIDFDDFSEDRAAVLERMHAAGVKHAICISVNLADFPRVLALARSRPNLWATAGVHPDYQDVEEPTPEGLCRLANDPKVIAIGETGLEDRKSVV